MDKENKIRELAKKMDAREDEFNAEKGNFDVLLLNGKTLSALIMSSTQKQSTQGKYKEYLEEQIKKSEKKIKDLKNDDKFYRRDFIEGKPLTAQPSPFWSNRDNHILTAFWIGIFLILFSVEMTIMSLPLQGAFTEYVRSFLAIIVFIFVPLFVVYVVQNFG
jgi:lipopolysaccharide export LptBFGC system permease protein LptF